MISFVGVRQRHPFSAYRKMTTEENVALRGSTVLVESNRNRRQDIARLQQILVQTRTIPQDTKEVWDCVFRIMCIFFVCECVFRRVLGNGGDVVDVW